MDRNSLHTHNTDVGWIGLINSHHLSTFYPTNARDCSARTRKYISVPSFRTSGERITLKVLIAYYSETGNTEKIAEAIYEEASKEHETHLKRVKDISAETLNDYDLVFLGSACHSSDLAAPIKKLLKEIPESPKFKLAGFFTHSVWTPEQHEHGQAHFDRWASKCTDSFESISKEKRIDFKGYFHCQGSPNPGIQKFIRTEIISTDDEWKEYIQEARKHPSIEDCEKASNFARRMISVSN